MRSPPPVVSLAIICMIGWMVAAIDGIASSDQQPLMPSGGGGSNTIPALPVVKQPHKETCRLDLSEELFGGVKEACGEGKTLDRSRCCPVLAAWLYAAHARAALQPSAAPPPLSPFSSSSDQLPVLPDDSQACVNSLQSSLHNRGIHIPRPNATCDPILCFCGIRLHQLTSLTCPAAFNLTAPPLRRNATQPTPALRALAANCTDSSYEGCTRCLKTLDKLKGRPGKKEGYSDRTSKMYSRDCELMGLTWLLAKNKTAYIPTVSAVLRAVMYSTHPPRQSHCSPDQENMPLALDSVQLYQSSAAAAPTTTLRLGLATAAMLMLLLRLLLFNLNGF